VFKVGISYVVLAWLVLQVADVILGNIQAPAWVFHVLLLFLAVGFPFAVFFAWAYELTPDGLRREKTVAESAPAEVAELPLSEDSASKVRKPDESDKSIAVLAFVNMSDDKSNEYFSDGISEEILNLLSKTPHLRVAARSSSFSFKGKEERVSEIGKALNVDHVLEGSVRMAGNQVRITAQLIKVSDGYHLWSESYNRTLNDIFAIQDDIALNVVEALRVKLTPGARKAIEDIPTESITAYDYYLRGKKYLRGWTQPDFRYALDMFGKAVEADPDFALAWAGLALAHTFMFQLYGRKKDMPVEALEVTEKALMLNPDLAEAHCARGLVLSRVGRSEEASESFETALRLGPDCFEAFHYYGQHCFAHGDLARAEELLQRACEIEPNNYHPAIDLATTQVRQGNVEKSPASKQRIAQILKKHVDLHPDDLRSRSIWACNRSEVGEYEAALAIADELMLLDPREPNVLYNLACAYSMCGQSEKALDLLEKAMEAGFSDKDWVTSDPELDPIRDEERFLELMERM
jgi:adenylate cyclase